MFSRDSLWQNTSELKRTELVWQRDLKEWQTSCTPVKENYIFEWYITKSDESYCKRVNAAPAHMIIHGLRILWRLCVSLNHLVLFPSVSFICVLSVWKKWTNEELRFEVRCVCEGIEVLLDVSNKPYHFITHCSVFLIDCHILLIHARPGANTGMKYLNTNTCHIYIYANTNTIF